MIKSKKAIIFTICISLCILITASMIADKSRIPPKSMTMRVDLEVPIGLYGRLLQLCGAIKENPEVLVLDPAFLQFQHSFCPI